LLTNGIDTFRAVAAYAAADAIVVDTTGKKVEEVGRGDGEGKRGG
jgi:hypothetical protein